MAGTKFAYVRNFELPDSALPETYLIVRIDGKGFHKFSKAHEFLKPNDPVALELMNEAAKYVMMQLKGQVAMAFGESDEYSFLLRKGCTLYNRRSSKITTHIVSLFTSAYVFNWSKAFPQKQLLYPPSFDGRLIMYPTELNVRDYFSWRQADTHINNLYNTTFWALVLRAGLSEVQATKELEGTFSANKHEILFSRFGINYDHSEAIYRKGTTLVWTSDPSLVASASSQLSAVDVNDVTERASQEHPLTEVAYGIGDDVQQALLLNKKDERLRLKIERKRATKDTKVQEKKKKQAQISTLRILHCDIIGDDFWLPSVTDSEIAATDSGTQSKEPWQDPSRLQRTGLGRSVFLD